MKTRTQLWLFSLSVFLAVLVFVPSRAQADDDDPPSRVARLSYTSGEVSFSPSGTDDWVSAVLNRPITTGDKLWTDQNSRAELHVGSAVIRLGDQTGFSFLNLDDRVAQMRLTEGTIALRVRRMDPNETIEIDTPNLAFSVLRPGRYRINVNEAGDTTIINVRDGEGEVTGGGSAFTIHPDQQGYFTGTDNLTPDVGSLAPEDGFDSWCNERDLREDHAVARRYVSDDVIGYEDLDEYGGWRQVPEYGTVWYPHVSVGWAPYRYGHWVWVSPWGWTWVDDAPWGFAPFHYGRWVYAGGGWGWVPCPPRTVAVAYVRPVYAPALVAWVGGPHFAAGVAFGGGVGVGVNVGWFPLGPREVYVPSYHVSRTYVNNVNISNTVVNQTVINNYYNTTIVNKNVTVNNVRYVNQNVPGGVTATSGRAFTSAQPVGRNIVAVNQREIVSAPVAVHAPAAVPPRQAVLGAGATNAHPPVAVQSRAVVARTAPPPAPIPFSARQAAIERNEGRPLSMSQAQQIQASQNNHVNAAAQVRMAPPARAVNPPVTNNRVNNAGNPNMPGNNQPGAVNATRPPNANNPNANFPPNQNQTNRPANVNTNQPPNQGRTYQDRPPASRSNTNPNAQLEQKHQQQIEHLQQKQDQQYEKLQQKQVQEQQRVQQNQNEQRQQQIEQKHQQQMQQLEQKQRQQQQVLQQKQQAEHQREYKEPPPSNSRSNQNSNQSHSQGDKDKDKPHH